MLAAAKGAAPSYGADQWTAAARDALRDVFETDLDVWLVSSGTAANALALATLCPPHGVDPLPRRSAYRARRARRA